ncbi:MAG TPA: ATP-binding protein, partial [Polyangiaceae bacterium]|nr:ATP-binding protein [Polyangiaceae bacterium]
IEAMPNGGELTLRTSVVDGQYLLEVIDTGDGVPAGLDIFEPFVTSKAEGTGLGLAICSEIVREHDGSLQYETTLGEGSNFRLRLPLAAP